MQTRSFYVFQSFQLAPSWMDDLKWNEKKGTDWIQTYILSSYVNLFSTILQKKFRLDFFFIYMKIAVTTVPNKMP